MPGHICESGVRDDAVRLCFYGEFDISNTDLVSERVGAARRSGRCRNIELDLSRVDFLGVATASTLTRAAAEAYAAGCGVTVTATSREAQLTLGLTGATEAIERLADPTAP